MSLSSSTLNHTEYQRHHQQSPHAELIPAAFGFRVGHGEWRRLVPNLAIWQRLPELLDAFVGDVGALEVQYSESFRVPYVVQPSIGDLCIARCQSAECRERVLIQTSSGSA